MLVTDWFFTFGVGQTHEGKYVVVNNRDYIEARTVMVMYYGTEWSGQYDRETFFSKKLNQSMTCLGEIN